VSSPQAPTPSESSEVTFVSWRVEGLEKATSTGRMLQDCQRHMRGEPHTPPPQGCCTVM
jgi:hypothetical protein